MHKDNHLDSRTLRLCPSCCVLRVFQPGDFGTQSVIVLQQ